MKIGETFERISDSWWPIPATGVAAAVLIAAGFIGLDSVLRTPPVVAFEGEPAEARQLLSTITSAMLSFIGLVFSVSIVVFTLASGQFSPRVLRTFLRDRASQSTLAVFVATFVLSLITLWAVRGPREDGESFVPGLTITVVLLLVAACVGMFVHFVHHITQEIRAVTVIGRIYAETVAAIDERYPRPAEDRDTAAPVSDVAPGGDSDEVRVVHADTTGELANVRIGTLVRLAARHDALIELVLTIGDFVVESEPIARVHGDARELTRRQVRSALVLDLERSYRRDVAFGIRKLVDIAERALSPGVNDPTTAIQCIDRIHALLSRLSGRALDIGAHRDDDGVLRVTEPVPSWSDYVHLACDELRNWGADSIRVHERLRGMLIRLLESTDQGHAPLAEQLDLLDARAGTELPDAEPDVIGEARVPSRRSGWRGLDTDR